MRGVLGALAHHRRRWTKEERQAAWTVAWICLFAAVVALLILSGAGRV